MVPLPFSPLDFWTCESWLLERQHHILATDSKHMEPSGETCLSLARYCHVAGSVTESSKDHSTIQSSQLLRYSGEYSKTSEFYEHKPITISILLWSDSLIKSHPVWNNKVVDKAFYKYMDDSFGRSIACRKGRSMYRVSIYFSKDTTLPFPWQKQSNVIKLRTCSWLIRPGKDPIYGAQCWSRLSNWVHISGCSQVSLAKWKCMLLSICKTFTSPTMTTWFISPLVNDSSGCGKRLVSTECIFLSTWLLNFSSAEVTL